MLFPILGISLLSSLLMAAPLKKAHEKVRGYVAFLQRSDESGSRVSVQHGLIAAKQNLSENFNWADAYGACDRLEENGFNDWHLPDKDELNKLYLSRDLIGGFSVDRYWSSTEYNPKSALSQQFLDGLQEAEPKMKSLSVRPVRTF
ncbi:MAG: DUF1566 domain-containing protein [Chlorobium sp.]